MVQIKWLNSSKQDLLDIYSYISLGSKKYAKLQVIKIQNKVKLIKKNILIGKVVVELNRPEIRELIEGNYRVIYRVVSNKLVHIILIHHSSRDLTKRIK